MRAMTKPRLGFGVSDLMAARDGIPDGESDSHWLLAAKHYGKIFLKRGPINVTCRKDWEAAVARVTVGEKLTSESEAEEKSKARAGKNKSKARAKSRTPPRARSVSSPEAESSDSDVLVVGSDAEADAVPDGPPRRSSCLKSGSVTVKTKPLDVTLDVAPRSPSSHSGHSRPQFASGMDSDIEELAPPNDAASRKRCISPSFDLEDSVDTRKRARSASYGSTYS
ncbi:hypothetical protein B0H10DRAFT_1156107 [Mycena sp. CBHHK59/15]|nr:hypothetical protein B0H10DRAFT_1156107 [Mycena sp. CBHHK59/15]